MARFSEREVRIWSDEIGVSNQLFAEQDLHIVTILREISENDKFSRKLYLKGGTAINKLHLEDLSRLSVDIDLNHIGTKEEVLKERTDLTDALCAVLKSKYSADVSMKRSYEQTTMRVDYSSLSASTQRIKIEISHVERFPILPPVKKRLKLPEGETRVTTYTLEELLSTKIRAFYDRFKGRDVYDIWAADRLVTLDKVALRKMFLYYFYRDRKEFSPKVFYSHLGDAVTKHAIEDDVSGYLRPNIDFQLEKATKSVLEWLGFLGELDARDNDFLLIVRSLLGKRELPKDERKKISSITHPLAHLFDNDSKITSDAAGITTDQIELFSRKGKKLTTRLV
ncbi:MAG: nucleotidyl transferase AbiEii/AbiGii toxin family protein [Thaumarchaeota archaeon]|nr:nucleotidyl transferase AbiEii/AbiGii toxin family protein [Nitrososphaerota archaeon]